MIECGDFKPKICPLQIRDESRTAENRRNQMRLTEEQSKTLPMPSQVPTVRNEFRVARLLVQKKTFLGFGICLTDLTRSVLLRQTYFDQSSFDKKAVRSKTRQSRNDPSRATPASAYSIAQDTPWREIHLLVTWRRSNMPPESDYRAAGEYIVKSRGGKGYVIHVYGVVGIDKRNVRVLASCTLYNTPSDDFSALISQGR